MHMESNVFGPCLRLALAHSANQAIRNRAQNGGVVTGLLIYALENKIIDGAIVSAVSKERPFCPVPILATTAQEIFESAGTRYTFSPNVQALPEALKQSKKAIAFVGTPCQIVSVRKMQEERLDCARPIKLIIGLMCSEVFVYEDLMVNHIQNQLGIDLSSLKKTQIMGKLIITTETRETSVPLAAIRKSVRKACEPCSDFSSELADISMGGLGLGDWTFVIVRTPIGEKVFAEAERHKALVTRSVEMDEPSVQMLLKLSRNKRSREGRPPSCQ